MVQRILLEIKLGLGYGTSLAFHLFIPSLMIPIVSYGRKSSLMEVTSMELRDVKILNLQEGDIKKCLEQGSDRHSFQLPV